MEINEKEITRIEVIGKKREYVNDDCKVKEIEIQDDGKTMKIFLDMEE